MFLEVIDESNYSWRDVCSWSAVARAVADRSVFALSYDATSQPSPNIHPDGERFLMIKPPASEDSDSTAETPRKIVIVTNWFEELKQRVPVD